MATEQTRYVPLVDTHAHVFRRDLPFLPGAGQGFTRDFETRDYVAQLDAAGVRYGVIAAASFLGTHSAYTLQALAQYDRLRATVIVDPDVREETLREYDRSGVVGIRLATGNLSVPPDISTSQYQRLFEILADLGWHVHVYGQREHWPMLLRALSDSPVNVVVDHFGARDSQSGVGSEPYAAILAAAEKGKVWVKLSGPYLSQDLDHRHLAHCFLKELGPERLLWGSDWPFVKLNGALAYSRTIDWICEWMPDEEIRKQIDRNALDLYRFNTGASL
ncbi:amidohydrolase [Neorhizobium galegae]|uniref:amidohydrolase family protein n=1 Tax=Neorhizobium galegae TaxID=399 RepID=UPI00203519EA|nr:amidohydrolase family protein [Neorhizobium galegae]MCM2498759.1 amidohydrolase family protein [Neorhizobium galegae]